MRKCARAVVLKDDQMLVMERFKMGKTYYTLLGGTVNVGENTDAAAIREVREESGIEITNPRLVFVEDAGDPYGPQYIYFCDYVSGEPVLQPDSEEAFWSKEGLNTYKPMWIPVQSLKDREFTTPLLKEALLMAFEHGWPKEPYHFSSENATRLS